MASAEFGSARFIVPGVNKIVAPRISGMPARIGAGGPAEGSRLRWWPERCDDCRARVARLGGELAPGQAGLPGS